MALFRTLAFVNKVFSIAISLLIVLQSMGVHYCDVVQLDKFLEHARFHSEQYGDNLLVFISKHYGDLKADHEKEHQEEKEEHEQLPFQHHAHTTSVTAIAIFDTLASVDLPEFTVYTQTNFHYQEPHSSAHAKGLLQPPRSI